MLEERRENKMGVMPIRRLLISMSLPLMASMLMQALYNVVDSIFVSRISDNAFTALSLALPVQMFMIAFAVGTGVGVNSLLSRRLGEHRFDDANRAAMNGIFVYILSGLLFAVLGFFFAGRFFHLFTEDPEIIRYGTDYLTICTVFSMGMFLQFAAERLMQSTGNTFYQMIVQATGAAINIVLDPIFIFGYFGVPAMGVAGAAIATVLGQSIAMVLGMILNLRVNHDIQLSFRGFRPDGKVILEIYRVGLPSIIMQSLVSVMITGLNMILANISYTMVLVLGIYYKLQSFVYMPVFGITNSTIPIVAYNYGARNRKRIADTVRQSILLSFFIMLAGLAVMQLFPRQLLLLFDASEATLTAGVPALRMLSISFVISSVIFVFSSTFQALGNGVLSMSLSITRQLILILPGAFLITRFGPPGLVWAIFPVADIVTTVLCALLFRLVYREKILPLDAPGETENSLSPIPQAQAESR
nr:MATE family efflux transporter [Papillibacter cinnamivorans]